MNDAAHPPLRRIDLDTRITELSTEKRALLAKRLAAAQSGAGDERSLFVTPAPRTAPLPLSFAQQRLWFLDQWDGGSALYNIPAGWWLQGPLDVKRLQEALTQLQARHESLRTVFGNEGGEPRQKILADVAVELPRVDLCALPAEHARAEALAKAQALSRQGFDLTHAPLLRVALYRVAESTHLLVLVIHHIISDAWSIGVLCRELAALYASDAPLPALPVQYPDYAVWQRQQLQGAMLERQLGYWRTRLAELPPLELPTDRPRPAAPSYRGARHSFTLPADMSAALKRLSRREGVTLYMLLLAAFQVLLARYSGQEDVAVGSPIAGRLRQEFEGLIGFFVNTLVLRTDLSGNPRFGELLARVREGALDDYAHEVLPFEQLVAELKPGRDISRNPLFQVMFALQNAPRGELTLPGLEVTAQTLATATAKFDLTLTLSEGPAGLRGILEYATDLFDTATIERMAGHFTTLLEGIVADPETPIAQLPLLTPVERHHLLVKWNDTAADYPGNRCMHQLFEVQAATTPDAVAVALEDQQLTYGELNACANQLAHHLRALGIGPEVLVGICLERSLELVIGLLAILKAGGAYVPLDPDLPPARLAFMLEEATAPVVITHQGLLGRLPRHPTTVCLDRDRAAVAARPIVNPTPVNQPSHLAYLMYTSGSTGTPKGVEIAHSALVNLLWSMRNRPGCHEADVLLSVTTVSFDIAGLELYLPLIVGGQVALASRDEAVDGRLLKDCIERCKPTMMQATPSTWRMLVEAGWNGMPGMVALCGGERLPLDLADALRVRTAVVWNMYGPTETTIWSTAAQYSTDTARLTIGRPIANTVVYVLDPHRQPVPVGVSGELYIGGDGLARGYWNRSEMTAERFVPDPFAQQPGARMYRTGDRVRYLPDGNLEFVGRLDTQVKLRGFRIELGEIEAVLAQQPRVRQAVVLLREDTPDDARLVAYVVSQGEALMAAELRAALKQQLPEYMVPAHWVTLDQLPLTPNGKIDRKALPIPEYRSSEVEYRPPRTPIEKAIAELWIQILNLPRIGLDDNFFDLGGHSLLAVRLLNRIRHDLNLDLSLRQLFETPTVSGLARAAQGNPAAGATDRPLSPRA